MFSPTQSPTARATAHDRTFAIGDLHGEVTLLRRLLAAIQPQPTDTLIFLGDYVDRGEDSVATVEELEALRARTQVVAIQGNHDGLARSLDGTWVSSSPRHSGRSRHLGAVSGIATGEHRAFLGDDRAHV